MAQLTALALGSREKVFSDAQNAGFSFWTILSLIIEYGLPAVEQVLPVAIAALRAGKPFAVVLEWTLLAVVAAAAGQPLPPGP